MVRERLREVVDRKSIPRKLDGRFKNRVHNLRMKPGSRLERIPDFENRNFGSGKGLGILEAAIATIIEDTVGVPFGADADVSTSTVTENGVRYVVDVNAPTQNMAEARAFIDSGTGFTSILTDKLNVENVELLKVRTFRDTFRVTILVEN